MQKYRLRGGTAPTVIQRLRGDFLLPKNIACVGFFVAICVSSTQCASPQVRTEPTDAGNAPSNTGIRSSVGVVLPWVDTTGEAVDVALGHAHTCIRNGQGLVFCWGANDYAQLGDGVSLPKSHPAAVPELQHVQQVALGHAHTCARVIEGNVYCWGRNNHGQLGDGTNEDRTRPVSVPGIVSAAEITAFDDTTCVRLAEGFVKCWGENNEGQIGDNTSVSRNTPTQVPLVSAAVQIAAGGGRVCALKSDNTVYCWGVWGPGQNAGTIDRRTLPTNVDLPRDVIQIAVGTQQACALRRDHTVQCWGHLGVPVSSPTFQGTPVSISMQHGHGCALMEDGTAQCWGSNEFGGLGDATLSNERHEQPVAVQGLTNLARVVAGYGHSCAINRRGEVHCWGANRYGQLGNGALIYRHTPGMVPGLIGAQEIDAMGRTACVRMQDGSVKCWGGETIELDGPHTIPGLTNTTQLSMSASEGVVSVCGRINDGTVRCAVVSSPTERQIAEAQPREGVANVNQFQVGDDHFCGLFPRGSVQCAGANYIGQLGNDSADEDTPLTAVRGVRGAVEVAVGGNRSCARLGNGSVTCWGGTVWSPDDTNGGGVHHANPTVLTGVRPVSRLVVDRSDSCAIMRDGTLRCGQNYYPAGRRAAPGEGFQSVVGLTGVVDVAVSNGTRCAVLSSHAVFCWGNNRAGQVGDGTTENRETPVHLPDITEAEQVAIGVDFSCVRLTDGSVHCWGDHRRGQLGAPVEMRHPVPVRTQFN